jgi:beta-lactam-binding protein with PASTA domain
VVPTFAGATGYPVPCNVTNVVGMKTDAAVNVITAHGCKIGTISAQASNNPKDEVIAQRPTSGSGPTVNLTVSEGPPAPQGKGGGPQTCVVPNVVGETQGKAEFRLIAANCTPGLVAYGLSQTQPVGRVFATKPPAGTTVTPEWARVTPYVSTGAPNCNNVKVVGKQLAFAEGEIKLYSCNLGTIAVQASSAPKDEVIAQSLSGRTRSTSRSALGRARSSAGCPTWWASSRAEPSSMSSRPTAALA